MLEKLLKMLLLAGELAPVVIQDTAAAITKITSQTGLADKIEAGLQGALDAMEQLKGVL